MTVTTMKLIYSTTDLKVCLFGNNNLCDRDMSVNNKSNTLFILFYFLHFVGLGFFLEKLIMIKKKQVSDLMNQFKRKLYNLVFRSNQIKYI